MVVEDRVAVVTGAGWGIGRATALRLAEHGAAVVAAELDADSGEAVAEEIRAAGGRAQFVRADLADAGGPAAALDGARAAFGGVDILVNNAGGVEDPCFPEAPFERWSRVLDRVNVGSSAGLGLAPHDAPEYAVAKAGLVRLTSALGGLGERTGVRVNALCPGWVDTSASRRTRAAMTPEERERDVPKAVLTAEQMADAILGLVLDDTLDGRVAVWLNGEDLFLLDPVEPW